METSVPSTPPLSCCSLKSKLVCFAIGLVALLLVAIASFVLGRASIKSSSITQALPTPTIAVSPTSIPTPDEAASWKTYTTAKYSFSFKYPPHWPAFEEKSARDGIQLSPSSGGIIFSVSKKTQSEIGYIEFARKYIEYKKEPEPVSVSGFPAAYLKIRPGDPVGPIPLPFNFLTIKKGEDLYNIYYYFGNPSPETESQQEKLFDQILSTFRFLE